MPATILRDWILTTVLRARADTRNPRQARRDASKPCMKLQPEKGNAMYPYNNKRGLPEGIYRDRDGFRAVACTCRADSRERWFRTQASAEEWRNWAMRFLLRGEPIPSSRDLQSRPRTVGELCELWLLGWKGDHPSLSPGQVVRRTNQAKAVDGWFGGVDFAAVTPRMVRAYRDYLASRLLAGTVNEYLFVVRSAFRFALGEGWIVDNPAREVTAAASIAGRPLGGRPRLDASVVQAVPALVRPSFRVAYWCQLLTGLRRGEVFGLQVGDLDFSGHVVHIRRQLGKGHRVGNLITYLKGMPKGGKPRTAALPSALESVLRQHLADSGKTGDPAAFLFDLPGDSYRPYVVEVRNALFELGVRSDNGMPVGSHNLRREYVNILVEFSGRGALASRATGHEVTDAGTPTRNHKMLSPGEVRLIRKHMDKYVRKTLGGTLNLNGPETSP